MANIKVKDLTDTQTINTDNEIMVLTNENTNLVQNITVENFIANVISSDSDNVIEQGADGKLYVETPENITGDLADLTTVNKTTLVAAINEVDADLATEVTNRTNAVSGEATIRANADNNLQSQIDAITAASDVTDIVGTYAQLQAYDTTGLPDNSIIKVLQDESRQNETTYYRWVITGGIGAWVLIGEEGPYYTISQADSKFATQTTVGNLNNLATSDKSSVVNAMNELASVLDPTQTADYIKNSKAIYSGEVSENALILPQIQEMAHSTFDLSKFTAVGSPDITSDGIASGFSNDNYLTANIDLSNSASWEIIAPVKLSAFSSGEIGLWGLGSGVPARLSFTPSLNKVLFYVETTGGNVVIDTNSFRFVLNAEYLFKAKFTGTQYSLSYSTDNGLTWSLIGTADNSNMASSNTILRLGCTFFSTPLIDGIIDLKKVSVKSNGTPVFSGNKIGIDTIKPDNYTVVGGVNITSDGIASGFSSSNYLTTTVDLSNTASWEIEISFKFLSIPDSEAGIISVGANGANRITYNSTQSLFRFYASAGAEGNINLVSTAHTVIAGVNYLLKIGKNSNGYYFGLSNDSGATWLFEKSDTVTDNLTSANGLRIGAGYSVGQPFTNGSVDLNAVRVKTDGDLVYQPCLKIPYTKSKTGSKIVDAVYRDRVRDMYEQFGYAPYYTLSDTDFTLPMGEVYGYLEKRARDIAHPIAQPFYRFSDEINEDEVRLEGAEVDKGLYLAIEQNLSAYCTAGSTSDKICLPDFRNRVPWGADDYGYLNAELPNIKGLQALTFGAVYSSSYDDSALYSDSTVISAGAGGGTGSGNSLGFNASRSNSIYQDNATVRPPSFKVRWLCRWK